MEIHITSNKPEYCSLYTHPFPEKAGAKVYCRVARMVVPQEQLFCKDCPLMIYDAEHDHCFGCLYYDTEGSGAESDEKRVSIAIENGMVPLFPYFAESKDMEKVEYALQYAAEAHRDKLRKGLVLPYIVHPTEVVGIVMSMTKNIATIQAAALHDVVEDSDTTLEELEIEFGDEVASLVGDMSEDKHRDRPAEDTWELRKKESIAHYSIIGPEAKKIALADKLSNIRATVKDYKVSGDAMWEKFNQKDKSKQEWYYRSLLESLKDLENTEAYREYERLVNVVF